MRSTGALLLLLLTAAKHASGQGVCEQLLQAGDFAAWHALRVDNGCTSSALHYYTSPPRCARPPNALAPTSPLVECAARSFPTVASRQTVL